MLVRFWFTMNANPYQRDLVTCLCLYKTNLHWYRFLFLCFDFVFILGPPYQTFNFLTVKLLMFSVSPSTYCVMHSEKHALYFNKFQSRVYSILGPLFRLPLLAKRCTGVEVTIFQWFTASKSTLKSLKYIWWILMEQFSTGFKIMRLLWVNAKL